MEKFTNINNTFHMVRKLQDNNRGSKIITQYSKIRTPKTLLFGEVKFVIEKLELTEENLTFKNNIQENNRGSKIITRYSKRCFIKSNL